MRSRQKLYTRAVPFFTGRIAQPLILYFRISTLTACQCAGLGSGCQLDTPAAEQTKHGTKALRVRPSTCRAAEAEACRCLLVCASHQETTRPVKMRRSRLRVSSSSSTLGALYTTTTAMAKACERPSSGGEKGGHSEAKKGKARTKFPATAARCLLRC